jgi:ankyrin repeat protein
VTALHLSAGRGHLDIVALLLERPEIQVNRGATTPLHLAVYGKSSSNIDVVKLLLKHPKMDVNKASKVGITPLYTASQHGHVLMVQALLAAGAEKNTTNDKGFTPLNAACFYGHTGVVRLLVDAGSDTELGENNGFTPILNAACKGYLALVLSLSCVWSCFWLDFVVSCRVVSCRCGCLVVVLLVILSFPVLSCREGFSEVVKLLVEAGVDIDKANVVDQGNPVNDAFNPLNVAAQGGHSKVVEILIAAGADVNGESAGVRHTPLMMASRSHVGD